MRSKRKNKVSKGRLRKSKVRKTSLKKKRTQRRKSKKYSRKNRRSFIKKSRKKKSKLKGGAQASANQVLEGLVGTWKVELKDLGGTKIGSVRGGMNCHMEQGYDEGQVSDEEFIIEKYFPPHSTSPIYRGAGDSGSNPYTLREISLEGGNIVMNQYYSADMSTRWEFTILPDKKNLKGSLKALKLSGEKEKFGTFTAQKIEDKPKYWFRYGRPEKEQEDYVGFYLFQDGSGGGGEGFTFQNIVYSPRVRLNHGDTYPAEITMVQVFDDGRSKRRWVVILPPDVVILPPGAEFFKISPDEVISVKIYDGYEEDIDPECCRPGRSPEKGTGPADPAPQFWQPRKYETEKPEMVFSGNATNYTMEQLLEVNRDERVESAEIAQRSKVLDKLLGIWKATGTLAVPIWRKLTREGKGIMETLIRENVNFYDILTMSNEKLADKGFNETDRILLKGELPTETEVFTVKKGWRGGYKGFGGGRGEDSFILENIEKLGLDGAGLALVSMEQVYPSGMRTKWEFTISVDGNNLESGSWWALEGSEYEGQQIGNFTAEREYGPKSSGGLGP